MISVLAFIFWYLFLFDSLGQAHTAYSTGDYRGAVRIAQDHLKRWPSDRRAALIAARSLSRLGFRIPAEAHYRLAGDLASGLDDLQERAYALAQSGQAEHAQELYQEILARSPNDVLALKRLAAVDMSLKQWKHVLVLADRLIAIKGGEIPGQTLSGIAHHELKHYDLAAAAGERVLQIDPELLGMPLPKNLFWNNLALDLLAMGRTSLAREHLTRALTDSHDAGLMELLGTTFFQQGNPEQAEKCYRQAVNWDPTNAYALLGLGRIALGRNQAAEAVTWLERAAESSPEAVESFYNLGLAYQLLGKTADALRCEKLAAKLRAARPTAGGAREMPADRNHAGHDAANRQGPAR